ncbi:MAG: serine hydrolase [Planctomycetota bacterium]
MRIARLRTHLLALLGTILLCPAATFAQLPVSGAAVTELQAFDTAMLDFMNSNGIEAGVLGVMKDGVVVLQRGYGWQDAAHTTPLPASAMMRVASVTKPITASAIRRLVAAGHFSLSDAVFDVGQPGGGLLSITPFPVLGDPRIASITVRNLLDHEGGWDRDLVGDLTYMEITAAGALGVTSPPSRADLARWILGQPLQHNPGTTYAYANVGYMFLGLVIEEFAGTSYLQYVHDSVFGILPVDAADLILGRTLASQQDPREPWYQSTAFCTNVFAPATTVNCPYGGWNHEARVSQGRIVAATAPLLYFLQTYYISGPSIGAFRTGTEGSTWKRNHTGSLSGTNALARQRGDGVNYAVLFNERPSSGTSYASQIRTILDGVIDTQVLTWPSTFLRGDCNNDATVNIADAVATLAHLFGSGTPVPLACESACDANDDSTVNIADAVAVLNSLFGMVPVPLPAPATLCGVDPTADLLDCGIGTNCP